MFHKISHYYALRHIASQKLMPISKLGAGYSHWNPSAGRKMRKEGDTPRLFSTEANAKRARKLWSSMPNCTEHYYEDGTYLTYINDGRKLEDLEIAKLDILEALQ